jgi:hypothetical protein
MFKKMPKPLVVILVLVGLALVIQLVPYGRNHSNPPVIAEPNWDSPQTRDLAKRACFDCHSNEVVYPWYSNIAPVSWLVQRDVEEARGKMNFSEWGGVREPGEILESVQRGSMPPFQYTIIHTNAVFTADEKQQFIQGMQTTLGR